MAATSFNDKVKEILEGLGDDDDFVEAVKAEINYGEIVAEAMQDDRLKRVLKEAAIKAVKDLIEDENDDSLTDAVRDKVDFGELVAEALKDEELHGILVQAVVDEIKEAIDEGDNWFSEALSEAVQEEVDVKKMVAKGFKEDGDLRKKVLDQILEKLVDYIDELEVDNDDVAEAVDFKAQAKALIEARDPELMKAITDLLIKDVDSWDGLNDDQRASIWEGLGVAGLVNGFLEDSKLRTKLDKKLRDLVESGIGQIGKGQTDSIVQTILAAPTFQGAVDRVISDMNSLGRMQDFAKGVVERALRESPQFQEMVLDKVKEAMAAKVADSVVRGAFG